MNIYIAKDMVECGPSVKNFNVEPLESKSSTRVTLLINLLYLSLYP